MITAWMPQEAVLRAWLLLLFKLYYATKQPNYATEQLQPTVLFDAQPCVLCMGNETSRNLACANCLHVAAATLLRTHRSRLRRARAAAMMSGDSSSICTVFTFFITSA
jgi:hypothetical protein